MFLLEKFESREKCDGKLRDSARKTMEGDASSTIDSSSEAMDQQNSLAANNFDGGGGGDARVSAQQRIPAVVLMKRVIRMS
ncbi:hypothetical protein Ocin01_17702 [Orchesella cincta]|uniref:Uncharacterized protein n=1 Tax=Orchesella cincta TaxID=48709 RepID=A0A1D2M7L7_ORCCI|nr:hypothetical protein Ocin01_17702 [Orchesella cincta]